MGAIYCPRSVAREFPRRVPEMTSEFRVHCTSLFDSEGNRVDAVTLAEDERDSLRRCDHVDMHFDDALVGWVCPRCGGTTFDLVPVPLAGSRLPPTQP